jgi:hypothetical protein|tara:strand:+ start:217 stop:420 length:204 start_codon:yes stop_codon:yes gene_type:complete
MLELSLHNVAIETKRTNYEDFATTKFFFKDQEDGTGFIFTAFHKPDQVFELVTREKTDEEKEAEKDA